MTLGKTLNLWAARCSHLSNWDNDTWVYKALNHSDERFCAIAKCLLITTIKFLISPSPQHDLCLNGAVHKKIAYEMMSSIFLWLHAFLPSNTFPSQHFSQLVIVYLFDSLNSTFFLHYTPNPMRPTRTRLGCLLLNLQCLAQCLHVVGIW